VRAGKRQQLLSHEAKRAELVPVIVPGHGHWQDQTACRGPELVCLAGSDLHFTAFAEGLRMDRYRYPCSAADKGEKAELEQVANSARTPDVAPLVARQVRSGQIEQRLGPEPHPRSRHIDSLKMENES
jgi:hypothetical protein